jgi:hypothetical protein
VTDGSSGELVWHRGQSCDGGACVEIAAVGDTVLVRSSEDPHVVPLTLSRSEWQQLLADAKGGAFDLL